MSKVFSKINLTLGNMLSWLSTVSKKVLLIFFYIIQFFVLLVFLYFLFNFDFKPSDLMFFLDGYLKMIITSWPAVALILGVLLIVGQHEAISEFIKKRLKSVGPGGLESYQTEQQLGQNEAVLVEPKVRNIDENQANEIFALKEELKKINSLYRFEVVYKVIFGSQLRLLETLRKAGNTGWAYQDVASYFETTKQNLWTNVDQWPLEKYLALLVNFNLIEKIEEPEVKFKISIEGLEFLEYVTKMNYSDSKGL
jgi:hypothetical protein